MPTVSEDPRARPRDPRLDFFRGLGMFIIMVAHIPWSGWTEWLPSRFGFSDGADMFVFCSGMASAIAFGRIFDAAGWRLGAARIAHRVWQVYWAHIGSFLAVTSLMLAGDAWFGADHYAREELALGDFLALPGYYLPHLMTLTYVPNYFDILPMYIAILCMVPLVMALARLHPTIAMAASAALWLAANLGGFELTADPATGRTWFFNPFAWQLIFFTGFAFARGWLPTPPRSGRLMLAALAILLLAAPVSCQDGFQCYAGFGYFPALGRIHEWLGPLIGKHNLGFLRYVHFLATAYIAFVLAGEGGRNLMGGLADLVRRVGQQTLAVFLTSLLVAQAMGMLMDLQGGRVTELAGRNALMTAFANLVGMALLVIAALIVGWFKSAPWRHVRKSTNEAAAPVASPRTF